MKRATGTTFRSHDNSHSGSQSALSFRDIWQSFREAIRSMTHSDPTLPTSNRPNQPQTTSQSLPDAINVQGRNLILMSCLHRGETAKDLYQDNIGMLSSDRSLMYFLKERYRMRRGKFRSAISMRKVIGIHFTQVSISDYDRGIETDVSVPTLSKQERGGQIPRQMLYEPSMRMPPTSRSCRSDRHRSTISIRASTTSHIATICARLPSPPFQLALLYRRKRGRSFRAPTEAYERRNSRDAKPACERLGNILRGRVGSVKDSLVSLLGYVSRKLSFWGVVGCV